MKIYLNPLESRGNYSATPNNNEVGTLVADGWAVPNVTAHPSTASVPITVLLCNSPLLCYRVFGEIQLYIMWALKGLTVFHDSTEII